MNSVGFAEYVWTLVHGDHVGTQRIEGELDRTGWDGYPRFLEAAFLLALDARFSRPPNRAEIIRFVANMRAELGDDAPPVDQHFAEYLLRCALSNKLIDQAGDAEMIGRIESLVLYEILCEAGWSDEQLEAFLSEAIRLADG